LTFVTGTLGRISSWAPRAGGSDVIIHAAAAMRGGTATLVLNNVVATRQLIEQVRQLGAHRFILISSIAVYATAGLRAGSLVDEKCPHDPQPQLRDPYSYSKIAQEQVAWQAHREGRLPLVVVRPGVIYGPGRDCITGRIGLTRGNFLLAMDGAQKLPYTFVDNCAEAIALAAATPAIEGEAFNVVDDDPPTAKQLLRKYRGVRKLRTLTIPRTAVQPLSHLCEWYHRRSRGQLPAVLTRYKSAAMWTRLTYSSAKAKAVLGWTPRVSFADGLDNTFAWLRQQQTSLAQHN
jgi:nucleoside-diphosphate-sugar epimerase